MDKKLFDELVDRYLSGTATAEEKRMVEAWYARLADGNPDVSESEAHRLNNHVLQNILQHTQPDAQPAGLGDQQTATPGVTRSIPLIRKLWFRYAVASVLILSAGGWLMRHTFINQKELATLPQQQRFKNDILPASQGVILTFGDKQTILLDSLHNGTILLENALDIHKNGNQLTYKPTIGAVSYHTVSTGKGKNYNLSLADGTRVWLDAESSLTFPTAFPGNDRVVSVTGQAYFEVASQKNKPFLVKSENQVVHVLGTHFNINAHEGIVRTTLLEGSIKISNPNNRTEYLRPGQQVHPLPNGNWMITDNADINEVVAWKDGLFRFNGASISDIMLQLQRWYDIKVEYTTDLNEVSLVAKINRNEKLSTILKLLEMTEQVKFIIDGDKVTVMKSQPEGP